MSSVSTQKVQSRSQAHASAHAAFFLPQKGAARNLGIVKAEALKVSPDVKNACKEAERLLQLGGDPGQFYARAFHVLDGARLSAAMGDPTRRSEFMYQAIVGRYGDVVDATDPDFSGDFSITRIQPGAAYEYMLKKVRGGEVPAADKAAGQAAIRRAVAALVSDPGAELYKLDWGQSGMENFYEGVVALNKKRGTLSALVAAHEG